MSLGVSVVLLRKASDCRPRDPPCPTHRMLIGLSVKVKVSDKSSGNRTLRSQDGLTGRGLLGEHVLSLHRAVRWTWVPPYSLPAL